MCIPSTINAITRENVPCFLLTFFLFTGSINSCGYHSPRSALPGGVCRVQVKPPDVSRTAEPLLSQWLAIELIRGLERAGIPTETRAAAPAILHSKILSLVVAQAVLGPNGRSLAARTLRLTAEFRLSDRNDHTLWRSGLLELDQLWPIPEANTTTAEAARLRVLQLLAARTAEEGLNLMLSGL